MGTNKREHDVVITIFPLLQGLKRTKIIIINAVLFKFDYVSFQFILSYLLKSVTNICIHDNR